jgi:hypothetical protein
MNTYVPPFQHYVHCVSNDVAVWIWIADCNCFGRLCGMEYYDLK